MKIMLCYDGSDGAKEGINEAIKYAAAFNAEVHVVTSIKTIDKDYPKLIEPTLTDHENIKTVFSVNKIPCETHIVYRDGEDTPGMALLEFSKENQVHLIIVGLKKRSKLGKMIFGSVAQYILLKTNTNVLCVRGKND